MTSTNIKAIIVIIVGCFSVGDAGVHRTLEPRRNTSVSFSTHHSIPQSHQLAAFQHGSMQIPTLPHDYEEHKDNEHQIQKRNAKTPEIRLRPAQSHQQPGYSESDTMNMKRAAYPPQLSKEVKGPPPKVVPPPAAGSFNDTYASPDDAEVDEAHAYGTDQKPSRIQRNYYGTDYAASGPGYDSYQTYEGPYTVAEDTVPYTASDSSYPQVDQAASFYYYYPTDYPQVPPQQPYSPYSGYSSSKVYGTPPPATTEAPPYDSESYVPQGIPYPLQPGNPYLQSSSSGYNNPQSQYARASQQQKYRRPYNNYRRMRESPSSSSNTNEETEIQTRTRRQVYPVSYNPYEYTYTPEVSYAAVPSSYSSSSSSSSAYKASKPVPASSYTAPASDSETGTRIVYVPVAYESKSPSYSPSYSYPSDYNYNAPSSSYNLYHPSYTSYTVPTYTAYSYESYVSPPYKNQPYSTSPYNPYYKPAKNEPVIPYPVYTSDPNYDPIASYESNSEDPLASYLLGANFVPSYNPKGSSHAVPFTDPFAPYAVTDVNYTGPVHVEEYKETKYTYVNGTKETIVEVVEGDIVDTNNDGAYDDITYDVSVASEVDNPEDDQEPYDEEQADEEEYYEKEGQAPYYPPPQPQPVYYPSSPHNSYQHPPPSHYAGRSYGDDTGTTVVRTPRRETKANSALDTNSYYDSPKMMDHYEPKNERMYWKPASYADYVTYFEGDYPPLSYVAYIIPPTNATRRRRQAISAVSSAYKGTSSTFLNQLNDLIKLISYFQKSLTGPLKELAEDSTGVTVLEICKLSKARIIATVAVTYLKKVLRQASLIGTNDEKESTKEVLGDALQKFGSEMAKVHEDLEDYDELRYGHEPLEYFKEIVDTVNKLLDRLNLGNKYPHLEIDKVNVFHDHDGY